QQPQESASFDSFAASPAKTKTATHGVVVRSTGLRLLSILGILHASLVLMAVVVILVMAAGGDARIASISQTIRQAGTILWTATLFTLATSFVLGFVMLYNAIGTLSLTPWSQRAMKLWSGVWLALSLAALIVNLGWIYPALKLASPERFTFARLLLVTWFHIAVGVIWPGAVLFYMNTRHVKQAYARVAGGASAM
ncbi:MAG: hypothetical protein QOE14_1084, partial [Humisphaera sp.]|nr:hypothetical protein [Humisphaera sp.]